MVIAEAQVATERSSQSLVQLCHHVNRVAQAHPQIQGHVEWCDDRGLITFAWGRCPLRAHPGALTLRAEAGDEERLQRIEHRISEHLERFDRGDDLTVPGTRARRGRAAAETIAARARGGCARLSRSYPSPAAALLPS